MSRLKIRCFGSFEVWWQGERVSGFESYRSRSLLAYLISNRDRSLHREQLAELFWPDRDQRKARHNLRQTLYNLRTVIGAHSGLGVIRSTEGRLRFDPVAECWIDTEELEHGIALGLGDSDVDVATLAAAVSLYRGEFLADFPTKGSAELDFWLLAKRETYREQAIQGLRALVSTYVHRGEFRIGVQFAQRLVAIDPLSEEAARFLIRSYALAGRRSQALAAYEALRERLDSELGVEPLEETTALYEATLAQALAADPSRQKREAIGPLIPMVGRRDALQQLGADWRRVEDGSARFTLIGGVSGVGKTRLANSMLGSISDRSGVTVLKARSVDGVPVPYQTLHQLVRNATLDLAPTFETAISSAPDAVRAAVSALCPDLESVRPDFGLAEAGGTPPLAEELLPALTHFLRLLCGGDAEQLGTPLVIFIDDLDCADSKSQKLLQDLLTELGSHPVWLLATAAGPVELGESRWRPDSGRVSFNAVPVEGLRPGDVHEIATALVGEEHGAKLFDGLLPRGQVLPLLVVERINYLWSEGHLTQEADGAWRVCSSFGEEALPADLEDLVGVRLRQLPKSARRLAALASVIGTSFEVGLLQEAADEHPAVVEVALELMLERWLIRQTAESWVTYAPERDIVRWSRGARRGSFNFSHSRLRQIVYEGINPLRRQVMHRDVCRALEARSGERGWMTAELLAHHAARAGEWKTAALYGRRAADRAQRLGALTTALHYCEMALESVKRLLAAGVSDRDWVRWGEESSRLESLREAVRAQIARSHASREGLQMIPTSASRR